MPKRIVLLENVAQLVLDEANAVLKVQKYEAGTGWSDKLVISYSNGDVKILDAAVALSSHASRHGAGQADAIPANALNFSQIDKAFDSEKTVSVDAGATVTVDKGIYLAKLGANTKCEYSPDGGTTWRELISAGGSGVIISDGSNCRLNNGGTAAEDSYLLPLK